MSDKSKANARAEKAAAERAAQAKREARRRWLTIGGVALAMALIIGGAITISLLQKNKNDDKLAAAASGRSDYGVTIGEESAPHKVVIYEDFLCPYCGELEKQTREDLAQLAADGKVFVEYRPFDLLSQLGDYPIRATSAFSVVLDASGPAVAKKFHDLLYENQPSESDPGSVTNDDLVERAVEAGAKESDVADAIRNVSNKDWVAKATSEAKAAGVNGTPTIILDGKVFTDGRTIDEQAENLIAALD
ncbi:MULTISPECIES: DsbA family protein [unclassified Nocardioides]|uniref:DsbA family protein n=1 Tax=unclassified Nocardioides TaxID=2615069 RepID=UPI000702D222|nr:MULTISPECIES: thioredoxin domain-containing protein [unclassified Nocardioides]KRC46214.1 disulfide bond formation protein DsbA [Nocardioides sp. Root79]KRC69561.1 disulfide bond formation protein DsbA [Nocardioides sp. Root240]